MPESGPGMPGPYGRRERIHPAEVPACAWRTLEWRPAEAGEIVVLRLSASPVGLRSLLFGTADLPAGGADSSNPVLNEAERQLRAYFAGELRDFELPLDLQGTAFQLCVWRQLQTIPYGEVRTYADVARAIGAPKAVRAVGAANGSNPVSIIVPCHRVIGTSGKLVGYGGGLPVKKRLLELESRNLSLFGGGG